MRSTTRQKSANCRRNTRQCGRGLKNCSLDKSLLSTQWRHKSLPRYDIWVNGAPAFSLTRRRELAPSTVVTPATSASCSMFTARWYARCLSVRPSARLSHTRRYCVETAEHVTELFLPSSSHTMATFLRGPPSLTEASNGGVWSINRDFRPISRFISELVEDRAIVTTHVERE